MLNRYFLWITRRRWIVVAGATLVVGAAALVARGLEVDYSVEQFFPTWGPERAAFDRYRTVFAREDAQVVFVLETPGGLDPATYRTLADVAEIFTRQGLAEISWVGSLPPVAQAGSAFEAVTSAAAIRGDPLYVGSLWNVDGSVHTVQGLLPPEMNNDRDRRALEARIDAGLEGLDIDGRWTLSGMPMIRAQVPELLATDQTVFLGGGILLFFVLLYGFFGQAGRVLLSLASVVPAYVLTLAVMTVLGKPMTILTSFIPIVIFVVGVCDSTHILAHWQRLRERGESPSRAAAETFQTLASSCFFTSLTTALGFASLAATGIGVIADFGVFTALAVMITLGLTLFLLPALLAFGRADAAPGSRRSPLAPLIRPLVRLSRRAVAAPAVRPLAAFGGIAALFAILGSRVHIDTYLVDDLKEGTSIIQDLRWIERSGFGLFQTNLFIEADSAALVDSGMVAWMERFEHKVENEPIVVSTLGFPDVLQAAGARLREGESEADPATRSPEEVAAVLTAARASMPGVVRALYRPGASAAQVLVTVRDAGSRATLPFLARMDSLVAADPPPYGTARVTGTVRMAHTFSFHVLRSFGPSIVLALFMIWLVMAIQVRSVRLGLLALIPNVFPLVALVGVMGLLGIALKPSSILVFSIAFGIAVDDSIHLMGRFTHLRRKGLGRERSVRRALRETGPALVMSTLVVSAGFSLLIASRFELLYLVGLLTATTALTALAADLFLFPTLLHLAAEGSRPGGRRRGV